MSTVPTSKAQVRVHIRWMIRRDMPGGPCGSSMRGFDFPWCAKK